MGCYVYTPRTETKTLITGEVVGRLSYAYKDFTVTNNTPKTWLMEASRLENAGSRAAMKLNEAKVKLLCQCDKFVVGSPIYLVETNNMRFKYTDDMMGAPGSGLRFMGYLAKEGRGEWFISNDDRSVQGGSKHL